MKIVQKWAAGFNHKGDLAVVSYGFRQTPKTLIMLPAEGMGVLMEIILGYQMKFNHQQAKGKLFDTAKEAANTLLSKQRLDIISAEETIKVARAKIQTIQEFLS